MNKIYSLRYTKSGLIYMDGKDDCDTVVDAMLDSGYNEEFCVSLDWDTRFISGLMKAGFLVMSSTIPTGEEDPDSADIVLPKLHLVRSVLFFRDLHIKRSIRPFLSRYELCFDTDFGTVVDKCVRTYGEGWLTPSLIKSIFLIREQSAKLPSLVPTVSPLPVSFSVYRDGQLRAGEFGVICGKVYTSYSGFKEESNAGTVQIILMIRALEKAGFSFFDFGMPLDYKTDLGAQDISPEQFVFLFRSSQIKP